MNTQATNNWKILIYMAADNNLKEEAVFALTEIKKTPASSSLKIVVQFDAGNTIRRYTFQPSATDSVPQLRKLGKEVVTENKTDHQMLEEFLLEELDPQACNMVVLSGHGDGAVGDFLTSNNPPSALSIPQLGEVLEKVTAQKLGRKIDILGMDSCLMSMTEVCYQLRGSVQYLIGSEGYAVNTGWPYKEIFTSWLNCFEQGPQVSVADLACQVVREYIHYYEPYTAAGVSVDLTACELQSLLELKLALTALTDQLLKKLSSKATQDAVLLAHWKAQSYKTEQYVDLYDFCDLLLEESDDDDIQKPCEQVLAAIQKVVLHSCYSGAAFQHSHGLSLYFPWAKADIDFTVPFYGSLEFAAETHWADFLSEYGKVTQRPYRNRSTCKKGESELQEMQLALEISPTLANTIRTNFPAGTKTNFPAGTKTNFPAGTKTNFPAGTKIGNIIIPLAKNPPDQFLKFDDECSDENKTRRQKKSADPLSKLPADGMNDA